MAVQEDREGNEERLRRFYAEYQRNSQIWDDIPDDFDAGLEEGNAFFWALILILTYGVVIGMGLMGLAVVLAKFVF